MSGYIKHRMIFSVSKIPNLDNLGRLTAFYLMMIVLITGCGSEQISNPHPEKDGYINQPETAIKIAEAVWQPIYGDEIYNHKPFKAELKDSVWIVTGTVYTKLGGAPRMVINKKDGRILELEHEL
jgi:hypothetical protein